MEELISLITKTYGIAGLIMLSPFVGLVVVWRHNVKLQDKIHSQHEVHTAALNFAHEALAKVQESRVADAKATSDKILTFVAENAKVSSETVQALDQVRELLMKITSYLTTNRAS